MSRYREDRYSNDEEGARYWARELGRDEQIDNGPTRAEADADEYDAERGRGYWGNR